MSLNKIRLFYEQLSHKNELENDNDPGLLYGGSNPTRKCTNIPGLILMILNISVLISICVCLTMKSDPEILINGYDDHGNICGRNNIKTNSTPEGFGENMEEKKFYYINLMQEGFEMKLVQMCLDDCATMNAEVGFLNHCYMERVMPLNSIVLEFLVYWKFITLMVFIDVLMSIAMLTLYTFYTNFAVILSIVSLCFVVITSIISILIIKMGFVEKLLLEQFKGQVFCILILFLLLIPSVLFCIFSYNRSKLKLTSVIIQEAAKAIIAMPLLIFLPIISNVIFLLCAFCILYYIILILSFCNLEKDDIFEINNYKPVTMSPIIFISIGFFWIIQCIDPIQYLIVSGCVAQWFYTRDKNQLSKPIRTNTLNILKYHLGTVCTGSLVIGIMEIVKQLSNCFTSSGGRKDSIITCICNTMTELCLKSISSLLNLISRNAFIMTAIYGYEFYKASIRSFKILYHNIFNVIVINGVADSTLIATKLAIMLTSAQLSALIFYSTLECAEYKAGLILIISHFTFYTTYYFFNVYEAAIDTIFLCFCEDCNYNNGTSKPYYMPSSLLKYIEDANELIEPIKWKLSTDDWENGPKRVMQV